MLGRRGSNGRMGGGKGERPERRRDIRSALVRWVVGRRPAPLCSSDEAMHPWNGRGRFAEEYSFAATQEACGMVVRFEWLPGRDAHRVWVVYSEADAIWSLPDAQQIVFRRSANPWLAGDLQLDCLEPMRRWQIRYQGSVAKSRGRLSSLSSVSLFSCDLEFVSEREVFRPGIDDDPDLLIHRLGQASWDRALLRQFRRYQTRGYTQLGHLRGDVTVDGRHRVVDAVCLRQHHWGARDWGAVDYAAQGLIVAPGVDAIWTHHSEFPFVTVAGGFQTSLVDGEPSFIQPLRSSRLISDDERWHWRMRYGDLERNVMLQRVADHTMQLGERGRVRLVRVRSPEGGTGIVAEQGRRI